MSSVVVTSTLRLASAPADVWPLITDTDRSNRLVVGSGNVYRPIEGARKDSAARFVVETRAAGFVMSYEEAPFEWTVNKSFSVYRRMRSGPLRSYTYGMTLDPTAEGGTSVTIRLDLDPRHWTLRPVAQLQGKRIVLGMARLAEAIDAHLRDKAPSPFTKPASPVHHERLASAERELSKRDLDPKVIAALVALVREGADADLVRIRPFEMAAARGLDPRETLRVLLHATTLGIVELRWALVCPSCRTANDQVLSLAEIGDESHCQLCDVSYGIELDRAVEATFVPHPSVREVKNQMFCIGGPWRTPHVIVQVVVGARQRRALPVPSDEGRYRLFARGGAFVSLEVATDAPRALTATLSPSAPGPGASAGKESRAEGPPLRVVGARAPSAVLSPAELRVSPGGTVTLENATDETLHVKIERLGYASLAATAQVVTTMSEFRRFFSKDLLKPSTPLKVASCAILFSDLTGSTALYTTAGDAAAFRLVDDHFDVLRKAIAAHGGAVVKTMGDAVMAAFVEPTQCVRAAVACLAAFEAFRAKAEHGALTGIKLGLFAGPCYVVTANDAIDYFGQTVNCASRVQHCAESGEIVFAQEVWANLPEADKANLRLVAQIDTRVKGVDDPLALVRVRLAAT